MYLSAPVHCTNFNSRPSARGDFHLHLLVALQIISIHAPPRGATNFRAGNPLDRKISIHAPPRGATSCLVARRWPTSYFNSRPSARGDVRGRGSPSAQRFQFTPLREGRLGTMGSRLLWSIFQFTPLREGRQGRGDVRNRRPYFNSRPSARGDDALAAWLGG